MKLRVDYLIYIYTLLCLCLLLFDFYYMGLKRWATAHEPKRQERLRQELVLMLLLNPQSLRLDPAHEKRLARRLRRHEYLLTFHQVVTDLLLDETYASSCKDWLLVNRSLFLKISSAYLKGRNPLKKAFFAYLVWQYKLCGDHENDAFARLMQELCREPSLYCRENALYGLYVSGSVTHVLRAYLLLSRWGIEHSPRLVTDGLMRFSGDHAALADGLWTHWQEFPAAYQTAFVNYLRMTSPLFCERFFPLLKSPGTDSDVKLAVIRYFRRYHYPLAAPILQELVRHEAGNDWEFSAIAALALENYPGFQSLRSLLAACHSAQWHVRDNASDSLLKLASPGIIRAILQGEPDPYTKEMLSYKLSRIQEVATQ